MLPDNAPTMLTEVRLFEYPCGMVHVKVVPDVHEAVEHMVSEAFADGVGSREAKFNPEIVTVAPPVEALFKTSPLLATGASNVST
jgi:hypothetical protein